MCKESQVRSLTDFADEGVWSFPRGSERIVVSTCLQCFRFDACILKRVRCAHQGRYPVHLTTAYRVKRTHGWKEMRGYEIQLNVHRVCHKRWREKKRTDGGWGAKEGGMTSSTDRPENHHNRYFMPNTNLAEFKLAEFSTGVLNNPAGTAHCPVYVPTLSTSATAFEYPVLKYDGASAVLGTTHRLGANVRQKESH